MNVSDLKRAREAIENQIRTGQSRDDWGPSGSYDAWMSDQRSLFSRLRDLEKQIAEAEGETGSSEIAGLVGVRGVEVKL